MTRTTTRQTSSRSIVPRPEPRLGPRANRETPGQGPASGFSPPETPCVPATRIVRPKRGGGVERIDRILAELLAHYLTDVDPACAACADPEAVVPAQAGARTAGPAVPDSCAAADPM